MSDKVCQPRDAASDMEAISFQAADWVLARRATEAWSEADQTALNAWLEESLAHRLAYLRLEAAWLRTRRLAALRPRRHDDVALRGRRRLFRFAIASGALAVLIATGVVYYALQPGQKTFVTAIGRHAVVALHDGSAIELNTDTVLRLSDDSYQRTAVLEKGEAFFHIKHDPARPFTVAVAGHRVTDLGTEFTIRREPDGLTVSLLEGRARLDSAGILVKSDATILAPGDTVKLSGNSLSVARRPVAALTNELAWRRGVIVFEDATLAGAAQELNRYNTQKIVIADESVGRLRFDASIQTDGIQVFARVARQVFGLHVESRGGDLVISR